MRGSPAAILALLATATACAHNPSRTAIAGTQVSYTAQQLRAALLPAVPGYQAGAPDSGRYATLRAIRNFQRLQGEVQLDKPQCASVSRQFAATAVRDAPAAVISFARDDGQVLSETLMSVPVAVARQQVEERVPADCRTFRARIGGQWSSHEVTESTGTRFGDESRVVGITTLAGSTRVCVWYVVFRSRGYLATISLYGPDVGQPDVEQAAWLAYTAAQRVLG